MACTVPRHQSAGSCSLHRGCGVYSGYSTVALANALPASSINNALTPVVPRSMPRNATGAIGAIALARIGEAVGIVKSNAFANEPSNLCKMRGMFNIELKPVTLVGRHVRLEPLRIDHAAHLWPHANEPAIWQFMPYGPIDSPTRVAWLVEELLSRQ